jgi:hypothetical protein
MNRLIPHLDRLAADQRWSYRASRESSAEPASWSAIALAAHGRAEAANSSCAWLAGLQQADGSVGINAREAEPRWPTSLAVLAWRTIDRISNQARYRSHVDRAVAWSLREQGKTAPRSPEVGHDTAIVGWSWAAATHSWLEPTCFFVLALRNAGYAQHARTRDGLRMIRDRLLPDGGANYGNTIVMGQALLPHIEPTGLALLCLAGSQNSANDKRIAKSLDYLTNEVHPRTAPASLAFACLGLAAHGRQPSDSTEWIVGHLERDRPALSAYERALLLLAAAPDASWAGEARIASTRAQQEDATT